MLKNLFYKSFLIIWYILGNKIKAIILIDTCITRFSFIDEKFAENICERLEIQNQPLTKLKLIQRFDSKAARLVNHAIYSTLFIANHIKSLVFLFILKLR